MGCAQPRVRQASEIKLYATVRTILGQEFPARGASATWLKRSQGVRAIETSGGYQEAMILVKGGYTPDTIIVRAGRPARLNFRREETATCSDKMIFADFDKSAELPTGETVPIDVGKPCRVQQGRPISLRRGVPQARSSAAAGLCRVATNAG